MVRFPGSSVQQTSERCWTHMFHDGKFSMRNFVASLRRAQMAALLSVTAAGVAASTVTADEVAGAGAVPKSARVSATQEQKTGSPPLEPAPDSGPDGGQDGERLKPLAALPARLSEELADAVPLNPDQTVLLDKTNTRVILRTEVACPDCILEMLLVPEGNREHETILRIRSRAYVIHSALLALGLEPGKGATFTPEFVPPDGPVLMLTAVWLDEKGELQRCDIRDWVRHNTHRYLAAALDAPPAAITFPYKQLRWDRFNNELLWFGPMTEADRDDLLTKSKNEEYRKAIRKFFDDSQNRPMKSEFVFVGSQMVTDPDTGREYFQAEGGHLICTSNFNDALIDVREESTADNGSQAYEGWAERIPPVGTPVLLILSPKSAAERPADSSGKKAEPNTP